MIALFVLIVFTSATIYPAASESKHASYKTKARRLKKALRESLQEISVLKAEKTELNQFRLAGSNERTLAMLILIQVQSELEAERVRRKAAEDEIARLQFLLSE